VHDALGRFENHRIQGDLGFNAARIAGVSKSIAARGYFAERHRTGMRDSNEIAGMSSLRSPGWLAQQQLIQQTMPLMSTSGWLARKNAIEQTLPLLSSSGWRRQQRAMDHMLPLMSSPTVKRIKREMGLMSMSLRSPFAARIAANVRATKADSLHPADGIFTSQTSEVQYESEAEELENPDTAQISAFVGPDGRPISAANAEERRIISAVSSVNLKLLTILKQKPDLAWQLSPRRFEELVAEIFDNWGYDVTLTPPSNDGGVDIYAESRANLGRFLYLIECKRYVPPNKVGVGTVRSLYGVVQTKRATAGAIVTTSFFTAGAEAFQKQVPYQMKIHDFQDLRRWIAGYISDDPLRGTRFV
jgi:hypothetical protein